MYCLESKRKEKSLTLQLKTNYQIDLPAQVSLTHDPTVPFTVDFLLDKWRVSLRLIPDSPQRVGRADNGFHLPVLAVSKLEVIVEVDASAEYRGCETLSDPEMRESNIRGFFWKLTNEADQLVTEVLNRTIAHFKYKLTNPSLRFLNSYAANSNEVVWTSEAGVELGREKQRAFKVDLPTSHAYSEQLGTKSLTPNIVADLKLSLEHPQAPSLVEQFLSEAQHDLLSGDLSRATLQMAISAELATKRKHKLEKSAGRFSGLQRRGKKQSRSEAKSDVVQKIGELGLISPGGVFPRLSEVENLIATRNALAHEGRLAYERSDGTIREPDWSEIASWRLAVIALVDWVAL